MGPAMIHVNRRTNVKKLTEFFAIMRLCLKIIQFRPSAFASWSVVRVNIQAYIQYTHMETISCILKLTTRNMVVARDAFKLCTVYIKWILRLLCTLHFIVFELRHDRHKKYSYGMAIFWGTYELIWLRIAINLLIYYFSSLGFLDLLWFSGNNTRVHVTAVKNWFLQHAGTQQVECDLAFR